MSNTIQERIVKEFRKKFVKEVKHGRLIHYKNDLIDELEAFLVDALSSQREALLESFGKIIGEDEMEELETPRLFQPNPTLNEMGGYSSVPFYCSLCGMGEMDIQDNKIKDGNYYCNCSVWTSSCGGKWVKWLKGEGHAKKIRESFYPNPENELRQELRAKLQELKEEEKRSEV